MTRFQDWTITLWFSCGLAALTLLIIANVGWNEEGIRTIVRTSAQTSVTCFLLAFAASSLRQLWQIPFTNWLLQNRRYIGVSFGVSHLLHLAALIVLGVQFPEPFVHEELDAATLIGGGLAYAFIIAMMLTSSDRAVQWLGPKRWVRLHTIGGYYIWLIFMQSYTTRALFESANYVPIALVVWTALGLRIVVGLRERQKVGSAVPAK